MNKSDRLKLSGHLSHIKYQISILLMMVTLMFTSGIVSLLNALIEYLTMLLEYIDNITVGY